MKHAVLKRYWGYDGFRPMQEEIIDSVLEGRDTLGLLPTGGGKSLTFQVPAMILPGLTIVVTPLISLMKDQVDNLRERDIRAVLFHSGMTRAEKDLAMTRCRLGKARLAYVSPERLQNQAFLSEIRTLQVSLLVVDEAHCISQWGYDFRPSYLRIAEMRDIIGRDVPVLALTASATPGVASDIMDKLGFPRPNVFARSFSRPNLSYIVRFADFKEEMLLKILRNTAGCTIIYVRSRKRTRELAALLAREGISAEAYHAGLAPEEKEFRQDRWKNDEVRVMVATNAFGMGIDKPDVRLVIHFDLPSSLEEYYQEAGRGGRDGKESLVVVIASRGDKGVLTRRVSEAFPDKEFIAYVYEMVGNFLDIPVGEGYERVCEFDFNSFCRIFRLPPVPAQSALHILTRAGYLEFIEETTSRSRLMVVMKKEDLYSLELDSVTEDVFQCILRMYTGLFADYVYINEVTVATTLRLSSETVYNSLLYLNRIHAISYIPRKTTPYIVWTTSREEPRHLVIPLEVYERQRERLEKRVEAMKSFVYGTDGCRVNLLLRYFGESVGCECGKCDYCRQKRRPEVSEDRISSIDEGVEYLAGRADGVELREVVANLAHFGKQEDIVARVRVLADEGQVEIRGTRILRSR